MLQLVSTDSMFSSTKPKSRKRRTGCLVRLILWMHLPLVKCQKFLEKVGMAIARNPGSAVLIPFSLMAMSTLGFLLMQQANPSYSLFYPTESQSEQDLNIVKQHFPFEKTRKEELIFTPMKGSNILNENCLLDALKIHNTIINITGFKSLCAKSQDNRNNTQSICMMRNVLELFDFNPDMIKNYSSVLIDQWNGRSKLLSNGRTLPFDKNKIFGEFKINSDPGIGGPPAVFATAIKITYFLHQPQGSADKNQIQNWERKLILKVKSMQKEMSCVNLYVATDTDIYGYGYQLFAPRVLPLIICFPSLIILTFILTKLSTSTTGSMYMFFLSVLCTGLCLLSAVSIGFLFSVAFSNATTIILVFLVGKGLSDGLMLIQELEYQRKVPSLMHRVAGCLTKIGLILTTTAIFDAVVLGFVVMTNFRGIMYAYALALIATAVAYFLCTSFLVGLYVLCLKRCPDFLNVRQCCSGASCNEEIEPSINDTDIQSLARPRKGRLTRSMEIYARALVKTHFLVIVIIFSVVIIAGCIYIHQKTGPLKYQDNAFIVHSAHVSRFKAVEANHFKETDINVILNGHIDYGKVSIQDDIIKISNQLSGKYYSRRNVTNWLSHLLSWASKEHAPCKEDQFRSCLHKFLATSKNAVFRNDIIYANTTKTEGESILISRFHLFMELDGKFENDKQKVAALRKDLDSIDEYDLIAGSSHFSLIDMISKFQDECTKILVVVALAIFLCSQPLTASIRLGILQVMSFILHVVEMVVLIQLWDVPLNPVTFTCLFIGLIWSLHFNIQILQVRAVSTEQTTRERTVASLSSIGPSIVCGVLISCACSISLAFVLPHLDKIFLYVIPLLFVFVLFHTLALLPTIMLLSSKPVEKCTEAMTLEEWFDLTQLTKSEDQTVLENNNHLENENKISSTQNVKPTVSVIGISCRFPQAKNKEKFWEMLSKGHCGVTEFPSNRPEEYKMFHSLYHPKRFVKGRLCTVGGAFLEDIRGFDAEFFKISPQEAPAMDPQQRILLHVVYEAIEDAGLRLEDLQKGKTGVFVGIMNLDYAARVMQRDNCYNMDQFYSTGTTSSIAANRISFSLNLTGPSLAVDTACSSSLTALRIAQDCLINGQCDVAIVCAPNIILDPAVQMTFSIGGLLAPDGRCKCFDASADGYGRGEGFVAVILKVTQISLADNDDIYCEILASGMNNDGQNAVPITAPSPKTQAELSKSVLEETGLDAADIEYVEAHGTGTAIGDFVEASSIASTYCDKNTISQRILRVGSVKSNLNHTESASGLAGLIKVSLMIKRGMFLPTINIKNLNPRLKLTDKGMIVQEALEEWKTAQGKRRTAALSSYGYGGSNVHAILREVLQEKKPKQTTCDQITKDCFILTLSAPSEDGLVNVVKHFEPWLREQPETSEFKLNLSYSLIERRSHHEQRLAVVFNTLSDAADSLCSFANKTLRKESHIISGAANNNSQNLLFVFGGQGTNWSGMGREVMHSEPIFNEAIVKIDKIVKDAGEKWSLIEELSLNEKETRVKGTIVGEVATFAIQYATSKLLESWGILPSAVVGHSLGEVAAACVAGALTLEAAVKIVLVRSKCHERCSTKGSMAAVGLSQDETQELIIKLKLENIVCVAAVNDYENVTISGDADAVESIGNHLKLNHPSVFWKKLSTLRAFHSYQIDAIKKIFVEDIKSLKIKPRTLRIPMYSTVHGDQVLGKQIDEEYWWNNMRKPVVFYHAMKNALKDGLKMVIEISPQTALRHYIHNISVRVTASSNSPVIHFGAFPKKSVKDQLAEFLKNTICKLYVFGYPVLWSSFLGQEPRQFVRFPTYPWQEKRFWYRNNPPSNTVRSLEPTNDVHPRHPFLAEVRITEQFSGIQCWETEIDLHRFPTFKDHVIIQGGPVLPGSSFVEMAIAMAYERFHCSEGLQITNVRFTNLLTLPESQVRLLRLRLETNDSTTEANFSVVSVHPEDGTEMVLATGGIVADSSANYPDCLSRGQSSNPEALTEQTLDPALQKIISSMDEVPLSTIRHVTEKFGFDFGPCYSLLRRVWRQGDRALCVLEMDGPFASEIPMYVIHPAFVDACFQTAVAVEDDEPDQETKSISVPIGVQNFTVIDSRIPKTTYCHVAKSESGNITTYDMRLVDAFGKVYVTIEKFQSTDITNLVRSPKLCDVCYQTEWIASELRETGSFLDFSKCLIVVLNDNHGIASSFAKKFTTSVTAKVVPIELPEDTKIQALADILRAALPAPDDTFFSKLIVINFTPLQVNSNLSNIESIDKSQELAFMNSVEVLKILVEVQSQLPNINSCQFVAVSCCAQIITGMEDTSLPSGSTVWGLCRTASLEIPKLRTTIIDLCKANDTELDLLVEEIKNNGAEDEIAFRDGKRLVNRLTRIKSETQVVSEDLPQTLKVDASLVYALLHPSKEKICLKYGTRSCPVNEDELEIAVSHFWIPPNIEGRLKSGSEYFGFSGQIINSGLKTGEFVFGASQQQRLSNILQVNQSEVIPKPEHLQLSPQQAATLPSCLTLAHYALQQATIGAKVGGTIIINEANRDLGIAGLLVARALGFSVFSTSSEPRLEVSKRLLEKYGAVVVTDSQYAEFPRQYSSTVEASIFFYKPQPNSIRKSCNLLRPGGKIVMLGETFHGNVMIPSDKCISYQRISYNDILQPLGKFKEMWSNCLKLLQSSGIEKQVLGIEQEETSVFDILGVSLDQGAESKKSFAKPETASADTICNLITDFLSDEISSTRSELNPTVSMNMSFSSFTFIEKEKKPNNAQVLPVGFDQYGLKRNRTYMVVGGVRGFGFEVARWMAQKGAGTIVLVARSVPSSSKLQEVSLLEKETGAKIKIFQADASSVEQMQALYADKLVQLPSMAGIVLTAMVLHDQLISQVDSDSFYKVMAPKVTGASILHEMSLKMDLDFFILFSSIASLLGNPGQASYSAANAFLDSLACYRRRVLGLPALSINWGPIQGAGVLQRQEDIAKMLSRAGYRMTDAQTGVKFMEEILIKYPLVCQLGLFDADWSRLMETSVALKNSARFTAIKEEVDVQRTHQDMDSLGPRIIMESDHKKKQSMVEEYVYEIISQWVGVSPSEIDLNTSLYSYGLDSFFGLTLKMQLETTLQVSFEAFYFMQHDTTPAKVVQDVLTKLQVQSQSNSSPSNKEGSNTTQENTDAVTHDDDETTSETYPKDESCPTATYQVMPLFTPKGAKVMFFCIHPAGRYAMNLIPISAAFKTQNLISFFAIGYTDPTMTGDNRSVNELARSYVKMIKQVQRRGPYFLGGQSFGGLVAYEMASILIEEGEEISFVAMIDTFPWEMQNRSGAARLEILFRGRKLEDMMEDLFQATFEQVLSKLASQTLNIPPEEYEKQRKRKTQNQTIEFLQNKARELDIPLYDIRRLKEALHQDNQLATRKHREWKPGAVHYKGPIAFLKSADQRYTPIKPLQESSDDAWSLLVDGNIDVYVCPGDHLALSEPEDALVTGSILANTIAVTYRNQFGQISYLARTYKQKKATERFKHGVQAFLHSRKGFKAPKFGKVYLLEQKRTLVFQPLTTNAKKGKKTEKETGKRSEKVIEIAELTNVQPGRYVAKTLKSITQAREVSGHRTGDLNLIIALVMSSHRVYSFELLNLADLKDFIQMMEALLVVSLVQK
ncbi:uncharacterized protein LOC116302983 isoform X2 [Actinia tenebrosa]|uniref:oleoyl-[acyl-carrier-protein] hydrolase n=1 Tax=Actinia tenebrosa TaxID=6105 RepID=A0A6P8IP79_ACTTE|nr:uncharacterized protein LOC116302983 isoform X2 [Actinia tenebrosa]